MHRRLLAALIALVAVVAAWFAIRSVVTPTGVGFDSTDGLRTVRLEADATVSPERLTPGALFDYRFTVTNGGKEKVRNVAVRSDKIIGGQAGNDLDTVSVSDPACSGKDGRVACLFPGLAPGETRTVRVEAKTASTRRPGDVLTLHTFVARIVPAAKRGVEYEPVGTVQVTTGRFG